MKIRPLCNSLGMVKKLSLQIWGNLEHNLMVPVAEGWPPGDCYRPWAYGFTAQQIMVSHQEAVTDLGQMVSQPSKNGQSSGDCYRLLANGFTAQRLRDSHLAIITGLGQMVPQLSSWGMVIGQLLQTLGKQLSSWGTVIMRLLQTLGKWSHNSAAEGRSSGDCCSMLSISSFNSEV